MGASAFLTVLYAFRNRHACSVCTALVPAASPTVSKIPAAICRVFRIVILERRLDLRPVSVPILNSLTCFGTIIRQMSGKSGLASSLQRNPCEDVMKEQWLAMEHYRLHSVEAWPDGPHKEGALAAIRATLKSLERSSRLRSRCDCYICLSQQRTQSAPVLALPLAA